MRAQAPWTAAVALALALSAAVSARAQTPDPKNCAETGKSPNQDLSNKLSQSNGVICPPSNVDPAIKAPAPDTGGKMPVIPPPGSPGGNPNVQPK